MCGFKTVENRGKTNWVEPALRNIFKLSLRGEGAIASLVLLTWKYVLCDWQISSSMKFMRKPQYSLLTLMVSLMTLTPFHNHEMILYLDCSYYVCISRNKSTFPKKNMNKMCKARSIAWNVFDNWPLWVDLWLMQHSFQSVPFHLNKDNFTQSCRVISGNILAQCVLYASWLDYWFQPVLYESRIMWSVELR